MREDTWAAFTKVSATLGISQAFTTYNISHRQCRYGALLMRTVKEELFWLREWTSPAEV